MYAELIYYRFFLYIFFLLIPELHTNFIHVLCRKISTPFLLLKQSPPLELSLPWIPPLWHENPLKFHPLQKSADCPISPSRHPSANQRPGIVRYSQSAHELSPILGQSETRHCSRTAGGNQSGRCSLSSIFRKLSQAKIAPESVSPSVLETKV